ncbi:MAG TPA: helix-turn-helix domain-containing protein, partial [Allocoleopsis sp.]
MDKLDSTQIEQLRAIGAYLYEIRQDQARSLEEIAAKTYIPLRLLKALEAGQEQILPEPVFIQGFIRRYGDVLGLDGTALSQQFPIHQAVPAVPETNTREFADSPQPS